MKIKLYEQVDVTGELATYCWLLEAPYAMRGKLVPHGWKWLRCPGGRGCYTTNDPALAWQTGPLAFGIELHAESNGSHAVHKRPMYAETPPTQADILPGSKYHKDAQSPVPTTPEKYQDNRGWYGSADSGRDARAERRQYGDRL